jgi:hypothetical protein
VKDTQTLIIPPCTAHSVQFLFTFCPALKNSGAGLLINDMIYYRVISNETK